MARVPLSTTLAGACALAVVVTSCGGDNNSLTLYSGRGEDLVQPAIDQCADRLNVEINVRYGDSAEMLLLLQEEGDNTPADLYYSQGAGYLGILSADGGLLPLDEKLTSQVSDANLVSPANDWIGITGRARTIVYNTEALSESDLPESFVDFTDPKWSGRIGWAPTNASFQDHITALRGLLGDDATRAWLTAIVENEPVAYEKNTPILKQLPPARSISDLSTTTTSTVSSQKILTSPSPIISLTMAIQGRSSTSQEQGYHSLKES